MHSKSPRLHGHDYDDSEIRVSRKEFQSAGGKNINSADEVIGEIGLVLVVILGIVVAINLVLTSLHIG